MKNTFLLGLIILIMVMPFYGISQTQPAKQTQEQSFYDIQKAFYDKWAGYEIDADGYYMENGERKKAYGWKQFKRWEWFWKFRVDLKTGQFPQKLAADFFIERAQNGAADNLSGDWTSMGPTQSAGGYSGLGRLNSVGFRPGDNNTIYVCSPSGGLWKTIDGCSSWTPLTDQNAVIGVSEAVVLAGTTPAQDTIYIATGDRVNGSLSGINGGHSTDNHSIGVLKSSDGGASWQQTGLTFVVSDAKHIKRLVVDPDDHDVLYAATSDGIYKTTDGAASWTLIYTGAIEDLELKPDDSQVLYATTRFSGEIFRSTDGGITWSVIFDELAAGAKKILIAVTSAQPDWIYVVAGNSSGALHGAYKSIDGGNTFGLTFNDINLLDYSCTGSSTYGLGFYAMAIAADPVNPNNVYLGTINTWKSSDGGYTWNISSHWTGSCGVNAVHADLHNLVFQNGTSTLYNCNDGGLYRTSNEGASWEHASNGLAISQMYRLGVSQTVSDEVIAGLQDNGTKNLSSGNWYDRVGGDGMECIIDYTDVNVQYGETQNGGLRRTTDHWTTYGSITNGLTGNPAWVMPYSIDPLVHTTLYAGMQDVFKSTDQGSTWTAISSLGSTTSIQSLAVAPSDPNYIYAAYNYYFYRTADGGSSWETVMTGLPLGSTEITYISIKDNDPNTVWVSLGQYNTNGIFQTTDGGANWTNISGGLPEVPIMCVVQNKQNTEMVELYAGTDVGVYLKRGSDPWILFNTGMPNVVIAELEIYYDNDPALSRIRAATYGRGLWESPLYIQSNLPPVAGFTGTPTSISEGETVSFTDQSLNNPTSWEWTCLGGIPVVSYDQNPVITYHSAGTYNVVLTASNAAGSDQITKYDYITVTDTPPIADFNGNPTNIYEGESVSFTDQSQHNPTSWSWSFPGGTPATSTEQNPVVIYDVQGVNNVSLTVSNGAGSDYIEFTDYITVSEFVMIYCASMGNSTASEWIERFDLDTYSNASGNNNGYGDYTGTQIALDNGQTYNLTLVPGFSNRSRREFWRIWIDYNYDGDFTDNGEEVFAANGKKNTVNGSITIPSGLDVETRMRVSMKYNAAPGPCEIFSDGEVEDYTLLISTPVPQPPVADFSGDPTTVSVGNAVQFTDQSLNNPTSWSWSFAGGTPSSSTVQHPLITYDTEGTYELSLTASNAQGSDTKTVADYITVVAGGTYCTSTATSNSIEWIAEVDIASFSNPSGANLYSDFTSLIVSLTPGSSNSVTLTPGYSNKTEREFWRIWIDFNGDADFDDADEEVFVANNKKDVVTGTLNIPSYASGQTRMRVSMKAGGSPTPCETFGGGEVEDYTVDFGAKSAIFPDATSLDLQLFPNPARETLNIEVIGSGFPLKIQIYDGKGRIIDHLNALDRNLHLNISFYSPGVYYIVATGEEEKVMKKFIKE